MRDMPVPAPAPPPVDHGLHDPLLIAQLAAGDPLTSEQGRQAAYLVARCAACAALAADLRAISAAVAWEPLPPRRRDFRIDPARAEQLRGSALQRFLRRLSFPEARALGPAAAGILSVGLLFMVAGAAWPGDDPGLPPAEAAPSPAVMLQLEAPVVTDAGPGAPAPLAESNAAGRGGGLQRHGCAGRRSCLRGTRRRGGRGGGWRSGAGSRRGGSNRGRHGR